MKIKANCQKCLKLLPFFLFRADIKIKSTPEGTIFQCPVCKSTYLASSSPQSKKVLVLLPIVLLLFIISYWLIGVYLEMPVNILLITFVIIFLIFTLIPISQHKMTITPYNS